MHRACRNAPRLGTLRHRDVAKRMVKFMEVSTIGVSRDSQLRAGKILKAVSDGYKLNSTEVSTAKLFHFSRNKMVDRWGRLRDAVASTGAFSLPQFQPEYCNFMKEVTFPSPAFAWLKCEMGIKDCESLMREKYKILTRSGRHFRGGIGHVRISMLDRDETFDAFVDRLASV
ncbi:hypothetical protein HPP92_000308 [Vanilla planifolia]|uniref:Alliinase C-terminal domain-containing protein n=1 Tax=Vanilla planifolia TaxID=51239 RepID=A0A835S1V2_VANPL|nr:hypothetical protein HPP92_000308 [Vanilla planifolia]